MHPVTGPRARRELGTSFLLLVAIVTVLLGSFVLVATALGYAHADVRGVRLEGGYALFFLGGLAGAVAGATVAAIGLVRRRRWALAVLAAVWPSFALTCLILDRTVPAPGAGRPLNFYLFWIGLLPAALTLLLARVGARRTRRPGRRVGGTPAGQPLEPVHPHD